ncbi:MAG: outer membrane protein assembly factor BamD [Thermoanaerobaculia bacterium]|nr:outer membrane protein assembly factor BamD [Thermoanaerobaculia bacterium]
MNRRTLRLALALAVAVAAASTACRSGAEDDPILRLSAVESLAEGRKLLDAAKYRQARPYLQHAFEVEPNSATGREALLLVADSNFKEGGDTGFIQAEAKYRDFQNRFPTSDRAAYVQSQIAASLAARVERPDRDQEITRKALAAYEDLLRLYPTSEYAARAGEQIEIVRSSLAEHEFVVGRFYLRFGLPGAAVRRLETLLADYPAYEERDKALLHLGLAYREMKRADEAQAAFSRLRSEHPASEWLGEIPKESR